MALALLEVYDEPCFSVAPVLVVYHQDTRLYSHDDARPTGKHAQTTSVKYRDRVVLDVNHGLYDSNELDHVPLTNILWLDRVLRASVGSLAQSTRVSAACESALVPSRRL